MDEPPLETPPYTALAAGYDRVMQYIDYDYWAAYVHNLLETHHPQTASILELGCGTGSLALALQPLEGYRYVGTDRSPAMIRVARAKAEQHDAPVCFEVADFTDYQVNEPVDATVLLYDGLNYLLEEDAIRALLGCTYQALRPGGVFVFDQSTPANSENNEDAFEEQDETDGFRYVRHSRYDAARRLHTTAFEMEIAGRTYREKHVQRAYPLADLQALVQETAFEEVAAYEGFTTALATSTSERVHHVLRRTRA